MGKVEARTSLNDGSSPGLRKPPEPTRETSSRVTPLHQQVYVVLRQELTEGSLDPKVPLPSEPDLAQAYGVSRVTIRRTLERLEADGLIRRIRGVGTFPASRPAESSLTNISGLLENLISYEQSTTALNIEWGAVAAQPKVVGISGPLLRIVRVRSYQGRPISLTTIHVPRAFARFLKRRDAADAPIIRLVERNGIIAERAEQVITAVPASALAAEKLGVAEGAPLIAMRRLMVDAARAPILHQESLYAPDRFEYRMALTRTSVGPSARWTPIG